jgi:ABC-type Fe3+-hydroxamate transport system substrate-binding protein
MNNEKNEDLVESISQKIDAIPQKVSDQNRSPFSIILNNDPYIVGPAGLPDTSFMENGKMINFSNKKEH